MAPIASINNSFLSIPKTTTATQDAQDHQALIITLIVLVALLGAVGVISLFIFTVQKVRQTISAAWPLKGESQGFLMRVKEFLKVSHFLDRHHRNPRLTTFLILACRTLNPPSRHRNPSAHTLPTSRPKTPTGLTPTSRTLADVSQSRLTSLT